MQIRLVGMGLPPELVVEDLLPAWRTLAAAASRAYIGMSATYVQFAAALFVGQWVLAWHLGWMNGVPRARARLAASYAIKALTVVSVCIAAAFTLELHADAEGVVDCDDVDLGTRAVGAAIALVSASSAAQLPQAGMSPWATLQAAVLTVFGVYMCFRHDAHPPASPFSVHVGPSLKAMTWCGLFLAPGASAIALYMALKIVYGSSVWVRAVRLLAVLASVVGLPFAIAMAIVWLAKGCEEDSETTVAAAAGSAAVWIVGDVHQLLCVMGAGDVSVGVGDGDRDGGDGAGTGVCAGGDEPHPKAD
jgi:hypothetical protein